jgi:adenosylmethionine-8-amino-7-oxononanoate aminotransferase
MKRTRDVEGRPEAVSLSPTEERRLALAHLWMPYSRWSDHAAEGGPRVLVRGHGCRVWDSEGREYLDGIGALEACVVGLGRAEIADAVAEQLRELSFLDLFRYASRPAVELAAKLAELAPGTLSRVHFTPGGSEAVEAAIKLARQYHQLGGESGRRRVLSRIGAFHGSTFGAMSVDGHTSIGRTRLFEPLPNETRFFPGPYHYRCDLCSADTACTTQCLSSLRELIEFEGPETVSAVIVDPAATYIGVSPPPPSYLQELGRICAEYGVLLIVDEVITGFGRTGRMFCCEHADVVPDLMTVSKGLSSGYLPIGAVLATEAVHERFVAADEAFAHGQTYGGHPAAAVAALENIRILEREHLVERATELGPYLLDRLETLRRHECVGDVRGIGLLAGVELVADRASREPPAPLGSLGARTRKACRDAGLLTLAVYPGDVMLLAPALTLERADVDELVDRFDRALDRVSAEAG